jgi:excisionase family DNA binding protein
VQLIVQGQERGCMGMQTDQVLAVGIAEAARRLGLSARTVATLVQRRELPSRKVGRRRIIPVLALESFVRTDQCHGIVRLRTAKTHGENHKTS